MANESEPVEGIYVLATDKNSNNMELTSIVKQIDAASRVVCPLLRINQIELNVNGEDYKDVKGLSTYFSYVDPDELRGTTDLMLLDTLVNLLVRNQNSP
ncbi:Uncharacterized protein OBRU01_04582 [Operophtera brumata]|uniref:Uncharacterized protein n=1 Tax=Operophtera brumata TaxID=104452 RepID=A0A0L7LNY5_OPEBR|nr:Uncharacterized protein OBRU01_04582 [Operophtera brumata]